MIEFFIPGIPVPKARPRVVGRKAFTPKATSDWEKTIFWIAKQYRPMMPATGPLMMILEFQIPPIASKPKDFWCIGRSDIDNYCKCVMDALHGDFYLNDNQIVFLSASKVYDQKAGVKIRIGPVPTMNEYFDLIAHTIENKKV